MELDMNNTTGSNDNMSVGGVGVDGHTIAIAGLCDGKGDNISVYDASPEIDYNELIAILLPKCEFTMFTGGVSIDRELVYVSACVSGLPVVLVYDINTTALCLEGGSLVHTILPPDDLGEYIFGTSVGSSNGLLVIECRAFKGTSGTSKVMMYEVLRDGVEGIKVSMLPELT